MNNWNRIFKPIVVLGVICVIVTGASRLGSGVTSVLPFHRPGRGCGPGNSLIFQSY